MKSCATRESIRANTRDTIPNSHRCQARAIRERIRANTRDTIRDSHRCQARATRESIIANARDTIRDSHSCQARATPESISANARDTIRDSHRCQARATIESTSANTRDASVLRNYTVLKTESQNSVGGFNQTIPVNIIGRIFGIHSNASNTGACRKSIETNFRNTRGNRDRCNRRTTIESIIANARNPVGNHKISCQKITVDIQILCIIKRIGRNITK